MQINRQNSTTPQASIVAPSTDKGPWGDHHAHLAPHLALLLHLVASFKSSPKGLTVTQIGLARDLTDTAKTRKLTGSQQNLVFDLAGQAKRRLTPGAKSTTVEASPEGTVTPLRQMALDLDSAVRCGYLPPLPPRGFQIPRNFAHVSPTYTYERRLSGPVDLGRSAPSPQRPVRAPVLGMPIFEACEANEPTYRKVSDCGYLASPASVSRDPRDWSPVEVGFVNDSGDVESAPSVKGGDPSDSEEVESLPSDLTDLLSLV